MECHIEAAFKVLVRFVNVYCYKGYKMHTTERFIEKARKKHGDTYNYSLTEYKGSNSKVTIVCKKHGAFTQRANSHLQGTQCPKCAAKQRTKTTEEFIKLAKKRHGDKYSYINTVYIKDSDSLTITCPLHGDFEQRANDHTQGCGCPKCKSDKIKDRTWSTEEFRAKANKVHNNIYSYKETRYINALTKVTITCPIHGDFEQLPVHHLRKVGCPMCSPNGFNPGKPGVLYYLKLNGGQAYKIGITNKTVNERFSNKDLRIVEVLKTWYYENGQDALDKERDILKEYKEFKWMGEALLESGNTELFSKDVLTLDR